jgi:hypothetical protein
MPKRHHNDLITTFPGYFTEAEAKAWWSEQVNNLRERVLRKVPLSLARYPTSERPAMERQMRIEIEKMLDEFEWPGMERLRQGFRPNA